MKKHIIAAATLMLAASAVAKPMTDAEKAKMDKLVTELMAKMTLDEKLGQLNLPPSDDIVTGQTINSNIGQAVAKGQVGGTFNIKGAEKIRELQRVAVEEKPPRHTPAPGHGRNPRLRDRVPHPPRTVVLLGYGGYRALRTRSRCRGFGSRCKLDFQPYGRHKPRPALGAYVGRLGRRPYLGSEIARAMVRGYQGDLKNNDEILACVKHFALYGASEAGRDYNTVDMSRSRMYNEYFAPYKAAVDEGAATVMTSFNLVDGVPATENKWLLDDVLRGQWGFDGLVVTDYGSIGEVSVHGLENLPEASARALDAGTDMDMCSFGFIGTLKQSVENGTVPMENIDKAVRRILEAKYRLGLFENPYKFNDTKREKTHIYTKEHRADARRIAAETFVLLKNDGKVLPLDKKGKWPSSALWRIQHQICPAHGAWLPTSQNTRP